MMMIVLYLWYSFVLLSHQNNVHSFNIIGTISTFIDVIDAGRTIGIEIFCVIKEKKKKLKINKESHTHTHTQKQTHTQNKGCI